jgi:Spy/CpxP family protein refolding chaperone
MKALSTAGLRCSLLVVLMAGSLLVAQDKKPEAKAPAGAKKSVNRLPNNFGKLNLSDEQKKKILDIQAANDPKIAELTAQLNALKDKEQADVEAVLTPDQAKQLAEIKAAAKK